MRQYNAYHLTGAFLFGASAGAVAVLLLGRVHIRRTVEARLERALKAERAHREARTKAADDSRDAVVKPIRSVGGAWPDRIRKPLDNEAADDPSDDEESFTREDDAGPEDLDPGEIAPDGDSWPPVDRDTSQPYIISAEEFADTDNFKCSLRWCQGDKIPVMVDEHGQPIYNYHTLVGSIGYRTFGGPSQDDNIAYIRNDSRQTDYEILRHYGSYAQEILEYGRRPGG